jgi:hypothetical protein
MIREVELWILYMWATFMRTTKKKLCKVMKTNIGVEQELIMTKCDVDGVEEGV